MPHFLLMDVKYKNMVSLADKQYPCFHWNSYLDSYPFLFNGRYVNICKIS